MDNFAFLLHPLDVSYLANWLPLGRFFPATALEKFFSLLPPFRLSHITGIRSPHNEVEGWFFVCPLTSARMLQLPPEKAQKKIIAAGKMAEKNGAKILGLGAFTSVVGDAGITVAKALNIPVTTGNSYTVATAVEALLKAAQLMGIDLHRAEVTVVGASGSIGRVCALLLARKTRYLNLVGRNRLALERVAGEIMYDCGLAVKVFSRPEQILPESDLVLTVTAAVDCVIPPFLLKPGAVVCDVARPRDVSQQVARERDDVLVIEGGLVEVPGEVDFGFDFGLPSGLAYACMAETMILALERRYESFTLGREISLAQVEEIAALAAKHGFKLAALRSFGRPVTEETVARIRERAKKVAGF
ncbi:MAG: fatty aldehyde-rating acyl-ACP reductase [Eubacteriales bacterium]|nr:fatty aldehyde-rating acyl-ACP reductase [Eubacteriales bacterium]